MEIKENGDFVYQNTTYNVKNIKNVELAPDRNEDYDKNLFPKEILKFKNLESLWIGMRGFEEFPPEIKSLKKLKYLDVQHSNLKRLPDEFIQLENLEKLILLWSNVSALPKGFHKLKNLKYLHLGCTQFEKIPPELCEMKNLETLILSHDDACQEKREVFSNIDNEEIKKCLKNTNVLVGRRKQTSNKG